MTLRGPDRFREVREGNIRSACTTTSPWPACWLRPGGGRVEGLAAFLAVGGNKADAARALHLARATFYERLHRIERICGADLSSAELRTSLHVALLALDAAESQPS